MTGPVEGRDGAGRTPLPKAGGGFEKSAPSVLSLAPYWRWGPEAGVYLAFRDDFDVGRRPIDASFASRFFR